MIHWATERHGQPISSAFCAVLRKCLAICTARDCAEDILKFKIIANASKEEFLVAVEECLR